MENKKLVVFVFIIGVCIGLATNAYRCQQKKYKMNLKCIQGELYEEIRTNMFV